MSEVCVTTFIFGEKYQEYLPLLLYSLKKSYPEYTPIIFLHGELKDEIEERLKLVEPLGNFTIVENKFSEIKDLEFCQGKGLRWVLRDNLIRQYEYAYFIDSDIIYCREPIPLHEQHIKHMKVLDLPFSNIIREKIYKNRSIKVIGKRIKEYGSEGLKSSICNFFRGNVTENRITGLHFIKTKEYFEEVKEAQEKYYKILKSTKSYLKHFQGLTDESVLYRVCEESGFDLNKLEKSSDVDLCSLLNFKNFDKRGFRPVHGVHLGKFRNYYQKGVINEESAYSMAYNFYIKRLKEYLEDPTFIQILKESDPFIKKQFNAMLDYYSIPSPLEENKPSLRRKIWRKIYR